VGDACMAELVEKHGGVAGVDTRLGRQLVDTDHAASPGSWRPFAASAVPDPVYWPPPDSFRVSVPRGVSRLSLPSTELSRDLAEIHIDPLAHELVFVEFV
jgi:hypothetical protein